jgi:hypothetical protein
MTDPEKRNLLRDVLQEGATALRQTSLQRMIAEGRRRRVQRRAFCGASLAVLLVSFSLWFLPGKLTPQVRTPPLATAVDTTEKEIIIRHLTEEEMKERLNGFAVAYIGPHGAEKVVLLEDERRLPDAGF